MLRPPRGSYSLQTQIGAAALATSACVLMLAAALFFFEQWTADASEVRRHQESLARVMASEAHGEVGDPAAARRLLGALSAAPAVRQAYLLDRTGAPLAAYDAHRTGGDQHRLVETRAPVSGPDGRVVGELVLMAEPDHLQRTLPRYLAMSCALFFAAAGAALFLGRWLAARLTEPLDRLTQFMETATIAGDLSTRPPPTASTDEIGRLTRSFAALLDRLQGNDAELRRTLGELVEAKNAAEAANVLKSQFLANVSHEIRTPLNGVLAMAQIMELGELPAEQRERLGVVRDSGEALMTVLNDVLDVSKIEAGELVLESRPFDPAAALRAAAAPCVAQGEAKGLTMRLELGPPLAGRRGDEARLRQIVTNLLSNAVKFTPAGEVSLRAWDAPDGELRIEVADTGVGVGPDVLPRLFQKFVQADSSTTRRFGGTGLGLAICRELAALMGGRAWAESTPGVGSVFHVSLPLPATERDAARPEAGLDAGPSVRPAMVAPAPDPSPAPAPARTPEPPEPRRVRVLAAEDNAVNRQVLASVLGVFGVEFEIVEDGRRAVEAWARGRFDVILMDVQMPVMDGVAATRTIREAERRTGRDPVRIVALSANAMTHQVQSYLAAGMDLHVPKPIEIPRLRAALEGLGEVRETAAA